MAELADALVSGTSGKPCRFKSCYPHQFYLKQCPWINTPWTFFTLQIDFLIKLLYH